MVEHIVIFLGVLAVAFVISFISFMVECLMSRVKRLDNKTYH